MSSAGRIQLLEVEQRVCEITSEQLGIPRERVGRATGSPKTSIATASTWSSFHEVEETFDRLPD